MKHASLVDGKTYEIGKINDYKNNKTYDINVIMYFPTNKEIKEGLQMQIIDYYHGYYDFETTEYYIKNYIWIL